MSPAAQKHLLRGLIVVLFALGVLTARVVTAGQAELRLAQQVERSGDLDVAIVHYRRAARWYVPFLGTVTTALDRLAAIGDAATKAQDTQRALSAWRAVRSAILGARSVYTPNADRLRVANEKIADLMASADIPPMDVGKDHAALRAEHLALLTAEHRPRVFWALLALLGFVTWVAGAFGFFRRALDGEDRLIAPMAWRFATVVVVGLGLFVLGLALA